MSRSSNNSASKSEKEKEKIEKGDVRHKLCT